jgi:predicted transcriptional regulator
MSRTGLADTLHQRGRILSLFVDDARTKRAVVDELDVSRSTVDRAVRDLEAHGLLERTDDGYVATVPGRVSATVHDRYESAVADVDAAASLLAVLDNDVDVDERMLVGATTMRATAPTQSAPLDCLQECIAASDRHLGMSAADSGTGFDEFFHEQVVHEGLDLEFVFTEAMAAHLRESMPDRWRDMAEHGFEAYTLPDLPYGIAVCEHDDEEVATAALVVYDEQSRLAGILFNDAPEAVAWARETYENHRSRATPLAFDDRR